MIAEVLYAALVGRQHRPPPVEFEKLHLNTFPIDQGTYDVFSRPHSLDRGLFVDSSPEYRSDGWRAAKQQLRSIANSGTRSAAVCGKRRARLSRPPRLRPAR